MPEIEEVFRMATQKVRQDPGALDRQVAKQGRVVRNRRVERLRDGVGVGCGCRRGLCAHAWRHAGGAGERLRDLDRRRGGAGNDDRSQNG